VQLPARGKATQRMARRSFVAEISSFFINAHLDAMLSCDPMHCDLRVYYAGRMHLTSRRVPH
jgi:hypothetical protein